MNVLTSYRALARIDARCVGRDTMLRWLMVLPPLLALLVRWAVPEIAEDLQERWDFDLVPYYPLIVSFTAMGMPGLYGMVIGFMLLDQRDDGTLNALLVTPLSLNRYLAYRILVPLILALVAIIILFPLANLIEISPGGILLAAVVCAPLGPLYALMLAGFAANKIQGLAIGKVAGILAIPALVAWFIDPPWQWLCGVTPHYWALKVIWQLESGAGAVWPYALVALIFQAGVLCLLLRRYQTVAHR